MKRISFLWTLLMFGLFVTSCKKESDSAVPEPDLEVEIEDTVKITDPEPFLQSFDSDHSSTARFKGVNWALPNDNFTTNVLILSGLEESDDINTILSKTDKICDGFLSIGANTVRLPINHITATGAYWKNYIHIINKIISKKMKVILAYWSTTGGMVNEDDMQKFQNMWDVVVKKYVQNQNVYFELINEPQGYSAHDLKNFYVNWLEIFPNVPRGRIILDGVGDAQDPNVIGDDSRLDGCLLAYHNYSFFHQDFITTSDWDRQMVNLKYPQRTIMTEYGAELVHNGYTDAPQYNKFINYLQGVARHLNGRGIGGVYWPGLKSGDNYSIFQYNNNSMQIVATASALDLVKYSWGNGSIPLFYGEFEEGVDYKIISRSSGKSIDVSGGSTDDYANILQWEYSGGDNQLWRFKSLGNGYYGIYNKKSNKYLDLPWWSNHYNATDVVQNSQNSNTSQQWEIVNIGSGYFRIVNRFSGLAMDVSGGSPNNGQNIIQWLSNYGINQQWEISKP